MLNYLQTYSSEAEYRADKTAYNYSLLKDFETRTPLSWRKRHILGDRSEDPDNEGMRFGSLIDVKLLGTEEEFEQKYHLSTIQKIPGDKAKAFAEALMRHTTYNSEEGVLIRDFYEVFKDAYEEVDGVGNSKVENYFQKFEGTDAELYYAELRSSYGKTVVSIDDLDKAERCVQLLKNDPATRDFFNGEGLNQFPIKFEYFGTCYKALYDRIKIDHVNKTIDGRDLKTSWKSQEFENEYIKMKYYLQNGIYAMGLLALRDALYPEYTVLPFKFCVIDASGFVRPLVYEFDFSQETGNPWVGLNMGYKKLKGIEQIVQDIEWHIKMDEWKIKKHHYDLGGHVKHTF